MMWLSCIYPQIRQPHRRRTIAVCSSVRRVILLFYSLDFYGGQKSFLPPASPLLVSSTYNSRASSGKISYRRQDPSDTCVSVEKIFSGCAVDGSNDGTQVWNREKRYTNNQNQKGSCLNERSQPMYLWSSRSLLGRNKVLIKLAFLFLGKIDSSDPDIIVEEGKSRALDPSGALISIWIVSVVGLSVYLFDWRYNTYTGFKKNNSKTG